MSEPRFASIRETSKLTGLSMYYIRRAVRNGDIPHIRSGEKYLINLSALAERLDAQSKTSSKTADAKPGAD